MRKQRNGTMGGSVQRKRKQVEMTMRRNESVEAGEMWGRDDESQDGGRAGEKQSVGGEGGI